MENVDDVIRPTTSISAATVACVNGYLPRRRH